MGRFRQGRNRLVKYYLRHWYELDKNIHDLNEIESVKMKVLYKSLKEISQEERRFLADKYRVDRKPHLTDAQVAKQYGMTKEEYAKKRMRIEDKLRPIVEKNRDAYKSELSEAIKIVYGT